MILTAENTTRTPHRIHRCPDAYTHRIVPVSELRAGDQVLRVAPGRIRSIVDDEPEALASGWAIPATMYVAPRALAEVYRRG